ncbi:YtxH domain-containing protein [Fodinibius saliphilus]|uniref:YtxH domain-containing protein n=1 Tax=Fodinibius saliphilus TaxID=1920650 RepID=UPI0011087CB2|nr:YtxH domain-containing protein [Fodinibius saliphilus]
MDSKKVLFTLLAGAALTSVVGILLTPYKDSSKRKKIVDKARDYADNAEETIKDSVSNVKKRIKKMGEEAERMVNEGGNAK